MTASMANTEFQPVENFIFEEKEKIFLKFLKKMSISIWGSLRCGASAVFCGVGKSSEAS